MGYLASALQSGVAYAEKYEAPKLLEKVRQQGRRLRLGRLGDCFEVVQHLFTVRLFRQLS